MAAFTPPHTDNVQLLKYVSPSKLQRHIEAPKAYSNQYALPNWLRFYVRKFHQAAFLLLGRQAHGYPHSQSKGILVFGFRIIFQNSSGSTSNFCAAQALLANNSF